MNACDRPYSSQIRSHVSKLGERAPASSSRYSAGLTPSSHAACPTDQPACFRSCSSHRGERRHGKEPSEKREAAGTRKPQRLLNKKASPSRRCIDRRRGPAQVEVTMDLPAESPKLSEWTAPVPIAQAGPYLNPDAPRASARGAWPHPILSLCDRDASSRARTRPLAPPLPPGR